VESKITVKEKKMRSVVLVALAAAIGNMLQGWDNATIAGISLSIFLFLFPLHTNEISL